MSSHSHCDMANRLVGLVRGTIRLSAPLLGACAYTPLSRCVCHSTPRSWHGVYQAPDECTCGAAPKAGASAASAAWFQCYACCAPQAWLDACGPDDYFWPPSHDYKDAGNVKKYCKREPWGEGYSHIANAYAELLGLEPTCLSKGDCQWNKKMVQNLLPHSSPCTLV
jgi:hypothetical protein